MRILVTGAKGFVGKNLCWALKNIQTGKDRRFPELAIEEVYEYDLDSTAEELDAWCQKADFVFNMAGVNRPKETEEFMEGNFGFASTLLDTLKKHGNRCPVMLSSSQQASLTGRFGNSEYGRSKKAGEELFLQYEREFLKQPLSNSPLKGESKNPPLRGGLDGVPRVLIYRFPNLFGKWCRPNYNSAVATFCNNIANDLPIQVNDPNVELELLYIDDLVDEMIAALKGKEHRCEFEGLTVIPTTNCTNETNLGRYCYVPITHKATLGEIVELLKQFATQPQTLTIPEIPTNSFAKKLYSTYLSYLPKEKIAFPLKMNIDNRGSFTELIHTLNCGQVSINISKPGITKGQHWHNTKWEFFIVVSGHGLIQQRNLNVSPSQPSPQGRASESPVYYTADPALYEDLKKKAEDMRNNPTEAECALWELLRGKNLDAKFRRQHIIGDYIVDFVCLDSQLVIEIDGGYHNTAEQQELDKQRTDFLQSKGFSVLRFTNEEVIGNTNETLGIIKNALRYLAPSPQGSAQSSTLKGELEGGSLSPSLEEKAGERLVLNWFVSGNQIEAVHMLPGYTHNIINLSDTENLVTVMYCNEIFDPDKPDTFFEPV